MTVTVVSQFDAIYQDADEEMRLWSAYIVAENQRARMGYQYHQAWRNWVMLHNTSARPLVDGDVDRYGALWDEARDNAEKAYVAWKRVAYPMYDIPFGEDDTSS